MSPEPAADPAALFEVGHCVIRRMLSPSDVELLRERLETLRAAAAPSREILYTHREPAEARGEGMAALMDQWFNPHRRAGGASTLAVATWLRTWVSELLEAEAVLFQDVLMDKRGCHRPFPWHQDFPFWPVDRPRGVVVWAALDPVDERRGGLCLESMTERRVGPPIDLHSGGPQPGFEGHEVRSPSQWVCPALEPGDAVAFAPLTWHASGCNRDDAPRRVWASSWLAGDVRWCHAAAPRHPLVRFLRDGEAVGARGWAPLVEETLG
jgi:ectoine hydroxylase-related dioxygenase (phytanoyl-CoA dioxygenase family)